MKKEITIEEIITFISIRCGRIPLTIDSVIFEDLGINGWDAALLMEDLAIEFNISLESFEYNKYYLSESELSNIFRSIFYALFKKDKLPYKTFTIRHLMKVVEKGSWFDPIE